MNISTVETLRPGDRIDAKYEVRSVLGKGGMGVVVEAVHLDLQETVALKFLLPAAVEQKETIERFLREARAARKLRSEHVVKVIDVGRLSDSGLPYMAMELLVGEDLSKQLETRGALPIELACNYVSQACDAIAEAHANGIVHRDIKPANLFVLRALQDGRPLVKVLDFGIAKVLDAPGGGTQTQSVMGSALYMSPEQMRSSKHVDARTDIWALGVTLYELLTGRSPFDGDSFAALVLSITHDAPVPLRTYRAEVPAELEAVVMRCLAKLVDDRFRTAGDLATALAPFAGRGAIELATSIRARGSFGETSGGDISFAPTLVPPPPRSGDAPLAHASTALDFSSSGPNPTRASGRPSKAMTVALALVVVAVLGVGVVVGAKHGGQEAGTKDASSSQSAIAVSPDTKAPVLPSATVSVAIDSASARPAEAPAPAITGMPQAKTPAVAPVSKPGAKPTETAAAPAKTVAKPAAKPGDLGSSVD